MKVEVPKSKFVYPDKLYTRTKDNKTLDISYAPQNMEAVEYTRTDAIIEEAVEWFKAHADNYNYTWYNEIERLKGELDGYSALEALNYIESYINALQKTV